MSLQFLESKRIDKRFPNSKWEKKPKQKRNRVFALADVDKELFNWVVNTASGLPGLSGQILLEKARKIATDCFKHVGVHCEPNAEIDIDDPEGFVIEGQIPPENCNIPVEEWFEFLDAVNDCETSGIEDNAPALQTQSGQTFTLAESDDEIIKFEQNQVTAQDAMSSIGLIRRFLANHEGTWPHMSSLLNIEDFIACQRQQNMRQTTLNANF